LARKAIVYVRQSSPHQVVSNLESQRLQYALQERAVSLGWLPDDVEVIDADLGVSAATAEGREGFKEIVAQLTLGQVGIILSTEVTRLARNCSDWYPLLDICGYKGCLIADRDGVYDPGSPNGRLLLGLKGQLSEFELHTIRARMTAGLLNKAQRGDLALQLPIGLQRLDNGQVVKDANREVQDRIALVFATFLRLRSASSTLRFFKDGDLLMPRSDQFGDLVWKKPTVAAILAMLKNPAYAGAFVYGRTLTRRVLGGKTSHQRLPVDRWRVCVHDKYPAYVTWEAFQRIQAMLQDNYAEYDRNKSRGIPRPGSALLHGIVYCGECGHKMVVQYKTSTRYICNYLRQQHAVPVCQFIPADPVDTAVVEAFFQVLSPVELDAYARAVMAQRTAEADVDRTLQQQLDRLRYQAALAERQFNRVDPDNRLVAAELETRWEQALTVLKQAEDAYVRRQQGPTSQLELTPLLRESFTAIGRNLPDIWQQQLLTQQNKKALLRCLIDKVVVHRSPRDRIQVRIVWKGGETTSIEIPIPVGAVAELSGADEMQKIIVDLSTEGKSDEEIAEHLSALGHRSPLQSAGVLPSTVKAIRLKHGILQKRSQSHPRRVHGYVTIPQLAALLDVTPHWLYHCIRNGRIQITRDTATGLYLFPDLPSTLQDLKDLKDGIVHSLGSSQGHQDV